MVLLRSLLSSLLVLFVSAEVATAFTQQQAPPAHRVASSWRTTTVVKAAESEVSFADELDGSKMRIGIIRTRWNEEHVSKLVDNIQTALKDECNVTETNIFETSVPGSFELPMAARFLALSGTVDAIIATGVLIKGDTMHFEFIADAVAKGLMNQALATSTPIVFGVLTCNTEQQVKDRYEHGKDWGKTAVEMALLRTEALGGKAGESAELKEMGFGKESEGESKKSSAFF